MPERVPRPRTPIPRRHLLSRGWFTWTVAALVATAGFFVVLWLTGPATQPSAPAIAIMANAAVSDATTLMAAVQTAGLRGTPGVKGAIDEIKRLDDERVAIKGWVVDAAASGSSLAVLVYADGMHVFSAMTSGPRRDVAQMFGLSDAGAANVSFQGAFRCGPGQKLIVVAIAPDSTYGHFRSLVCP
jgi:hypothetical protein